MVKCADCGFLAAREIETRNLEETETAFRDSGVPPVIELRPGGGRSLHEPLPLCFARRYNLIKEFKEFAGKDYPDRTSVFPVLNEERECEAFTKWHQGFTPKEHREMLDRKLMMDFQAKREQEVGKISNMLIEHILNSYRISRTRKLVLLIHFH